MGPVAFIDNFINEPVNHCVNDICEKYLIPSTYHQPARFGFRSLEALKSPPQAVIILGSASHVLESLDWHKKLSEFIDVWAGQNIPILGICFGHQLLVKHFGGEVDYHTKPPVNIKSVRTITLEADLWSYKRGDRLSLPYAHEQAVIEIPESFITIGSAKDLPFEIIRHETKPIFSIQAHPESSLEFISDITFNTEFEGEVQKIHRDGFQFIKSFLDSSTSS